MAAASGHPAVKAVSPQAPVTNWFIGDDFHHNGVLPTAPSIFHSGVAGGFGVPRPVPVKVGPQSKGLQIQDNYKFYLETGSLKNLSKLNGDTIAFWTEVMNHPDYDEWWKNRVMPEMPQKI